MVTSQKDKNIHQRGATPPGRTEPVPPTMPIKDERDSVVKFDGRPGATFDVYEETILNVAAGKTDERGWSLADHLLEVDENAGESRIAVAAVEKVASENEVLFTSAVTCKFQAAVAPHAPPPTGSS